MSSFGGEEYTNSFYDYVLPQALDAGLLDDPGDTLHIYGSTRTVVHKKQIHCHVCLSDDPPTSRYIQVIDATRDAIKHHYEPGQVFCFLCPDTLYLGDFFRTLRRMLALGYDAVMLPAFRADKQAFLRERPKGLRAAIEFGLNHLHPITAAQVFDTYTSDWPSCIYWSAAHRLIGHIWHWCPVAIRMSRLCLNLGTIDADLIHNSSMDTNKIYYAQNSDELCAIELSIVDRPMPVAHFPNLEHLRSFKNNFTKPFDRTLFSHQVLWHSQDVDAATLQDQKIAAVYAAQVLE